MWCFSSSSCLTSWRINHLSPSLHTLWTDISIGLHFIDSRGCFRMIVHPVPETCAWILCLKCSDFPCVWRRRIIKTSIQILYQFKLKSREQRDIVLLSFVVSCSLVVYEQTYLILIPSPPQSPSSSSSHPLESQQHPDNDWFKRWGSHEESQWISRQELLSGQEHLSNRCYWIHWKSKTKEIKGDKLFSSS